MSDAYISRASVEFAGGQRDGVMDSVVVRPSSGKPTSDKR